MLDPTIRAANIAVLIKLETTEGVDALPDPAIDAIPVEVDGLTRNSPWTTEASNEATGSYVSGAPLVIGQAATVGFRSRIKGAGAGAVYSPTVKPPLHAAFAASGLRPQFRAAVPPSLASSGSASTALIDKQSMVVLARAAVGMIAQIAGGTGAGRTPVIVDFSNGDSNQRVAVLGESFNPPLDATTNIGIAANWTYSGTSPVDAAARVTDHPSATIYVYRDGQLWKWVGCRGTLNLDGRSARPGFAAFTFNGIFAGRTDAPMPASVAVASHQAPTLVRGSNGSAVALLNRRELSLQTWSLALGSQVTSPDNPNTPYGFDSGQIGERTPVLTVDPLATLAATRDTIAQIGTGTTMPAVLRHGTQAGNIWAVTLPLVQPTGESDSSRENLVGEQITLQARSLGKDPVGRETDVVLTFA